MSGSRLLALSCVPYTLFSTLFPTRPSSPLQSFHLMIRQWLLPPLPLQSFNLMNLVIERMGDHIRPFVEDMLRVLPVLWQRSEGSSLVRIQV